MPVDSPSAAPLSDHDDPDQDGSDGHDDARRSSPSGRWRPTRILILVVVAGLLAMWGYVLYLAFGPGQQPQIDQLTDPAFGRAAEHRCADAVQAVEELPLATESKTATGRADVLDQANADFAAMLHDLDGMVHLVPSGDDRRKTTEWLADWRTFLRDRQDYADALRKDPDARLLVSEKAGTTQHITDWIDEFALANHMDSCVSPTDA
jgi:hypothetical protein